MEIYILRHGEADPRAADSKDADRALTPRGKRDVREVLAAVRAAKLAPQLIITSPLLRAQQTAAVAAKLLSKATIKESRHLLPAANPSLLWKEIGDLKDVQTILAVGHEPHLSSFLRFLLESAVAVDLKKGALVRITTANRVGPPRGVLKWMITPKLARAR
jgi:phosphohistidine phosphatase